MKEKHTIIMNTMLSFLARAACLSFCLSHSLIFSLLLEFIYLFVLYLKLTIKTDTIMCTIKNSYAAKYMLIYVNLLTINFVNKKVTKIIKATTNGNL